jgi:twitching motility protein PilJ
MNGISASQKSEEISRLHSTFTPPLKLDISEDVAQRIAAQSQANRAVSERQKFSIFQWFNNLSISRKHLIALLTTELVPLLGLGVGGSLIIHQGWQAQLQEQAKSGVAVTNINYQSKFKHISSGFRAQAGNSAIIKAANLKSSGQEVQADLEAKVKEILQHEIENRQIEHASLVGTNGRILISANAKHHGKEFDPQGLVSEVFRTGQQTSANAIVRGEELQKEAAFISTNLGNKDALVSYTATPVKARGENKVIGVLVAGEIVNGKQEIIEESLEATGDGYGAIYINQGGGKFTLATSLAVGNAQDLGGKQRNLELSDKSILAKASANPEREIITGSMAVGNQKYTIAAKALPNKILKNGDKDIPVFDGEPLAILVQGTPETYLKQLLTQNLLQQLVVGILAVAMVIAWVAILRRTIIEPLEKIKQANQKLATGERSVRAEEFNIDEVGELAIAFNKMADNIAEKIRRQENNAKVAQLLSKISVGVRGTLSTEEILDAAVIHTRESIKADRVIVYRFDENWVGKVIAESVGEEFPVAMGAEIDDPCFAKDYVEKYQAGRVAAIENIYEAGLTECYLAQLEPFAVKANLVAPILLNNKLYGLLIAHQCDAPRKWQNSEINLFRQVAVPIGFALEQALLLEKVDKARLAAENMSLEQRQQKESLEQQLMQLVMDVEDACKGDLTVHAEVTAGEIGIVADFFNSIVESLRDIVTKVQNSAVQVNSAIGENEGAVRQLAEEASKQATEITRTLDAVDEMTQSIVGVAENAQKAAQVANIASRTAQKSGIAMDMTVQNIMKLRSTVGDTAKKVKRLGESSQEITRVVSLIQQIATQTNLLAVNAGLEAARAGDGREGFGAIAQEIAELAARCTSATEEIEQFVENIQRETSAVAKAMELGTAQVVEGTHIVQDAKHSLGQILQVSHEIDTLVQSISQATVSQVETSQTVTQLMKDIARISEFTSDSSYQVSQTLQATVEISQQLQETVGTFKVS